MLEDLPHALLECSFNSSVNDWILAVLYNLDPSLIDADLSSINLITLNFQIQPASMFPVVWFLATSLRIVWQGRRDRKPISNDKLRSMIGADLDSLKKSKHKKSAEIIDNAIDFKM